MALKKRPAGSFLEKTNAEIAAQVAMRHPCAGAGILAIMKRPSAAAGSDEEPPNDFDPLRDRLTARKFRELFSIMPPAVVEEYKKAIR